MKTRTQNPSLLLRAMVSVATGLALAVWLSACAGSVEDPPGGPQDAMLAEAPGWVVSDCTRYWSGKRGARLCGVGSVAGTRNLSLARTAAMGRARSEIASNLQPMVEAMLRDYSTATARDEKDGADPLSEQQIQNVTAQITQFTTTRGTTLRDTWVAPDGTLYTLVELDLQHFVDSLDQMSSLTDAIRAGVKGRAGPAFRAVGQGPATSN